MKELFAFLMVAAIALGAYHTFYIPENPTIGEVVSELRK